MFEHRRSRAAGRVVYESGLTDSAGAIPAGYGGQLRCCGVLESLAPLGPVENLYSSSPDGTVSYRHGC